MQPLQLFDTAFRRNEWLAQRQSVISANIANANTPGYKAKDIESFDDVMRKAVPMSVTDPQHLSVRRQRRNWLATPIPTRRKFWNPATTSASRKSF